MARGGGKETSDQVLYGTTSRTRRASLGPNVDQPDWPTSLSKVRFDYGDLDYEIEDDYSDHHICGDGMCRCRRIIEVTVTDVMPRDLARRIIEKMQIDQCNQQEDIERFLRSKAGKPLKDESRSKIYQAYKKQAAQQSRQQLYRPTGAGEMLTPEQADYEFDDTDQLVLEQILQESGINAEDFHADIVGGYYGEEVDGVYLEGEICSKIADRWNDYLRARGDSRIAKLSWLPTAQGKIKTSRKAEVDPSKIQLPSVDPLITEYSAAYKEHYAAELRILARRQGKSLSRPDRQDEAPAAVLRGSQDKQSYAVISGAAAIKGAADAGKPQLNVLVIS